MPRFFFNVHDGQSIPDEEGTELASVGAARAHATTYAGELLRDAPHTFWSGDEWKMDVTDERGLILFSLMFVAIDSPVTMKPFKGSQSTD